MPNTASWSFLPKRYNGAPHCTTEWASQVAQCHLPVQEMWLQPLGGEDPLEEEMATHSSILAWRIPWTKELGGLQSRGSQRVRHD